MARTHLSAYRPLIARPFDHSAVFSEIPPCEALRPYVRCFWGGEAASAAAVARGEPDWIIPDGCADVIFRVNETRGTVHAGFAGISDACGETHFLRLRRTGFPHWASDFMRGRPIASPTRA